jgi:DNA adenine methylase
VTLFAESTQIVNVAQVRKLSPFRYAGGKTWLVPDVLRWLGNLSRPDIFVEPFAGGAIVGLTIAVENLADRVVLSELDPDVASVWKIIFGDDEDAAEELYHRILAADITSAFVRRIIDAEPQTTLERAFRTIIKNRTQRGGILAPGAGLIKSGENGHGLTSRWYPQTLVKRMSTLRAVRHRVSFIEGDAFDVTRAFLDDPRAVFFIDPPYTAGGKRAGVRLYLHNTIDHECLFAHMANAAGCVMMTYDDTPEVVNLANRHGFSIERVPMKNTHHAVMNELLILKP